MRIFHRNPRQRFDALMREAKASVARSRRRADAGWRWHWPITMPFIYVFEMIDTAVLRWRVARFRAKLDREGRR